jgi:hypothetical protein
MDIAVVSITTMMNMMATITTTRPKLQCLVSSQSWESQVGAKPQAWDA